MKIFPFVLFGYFVLAAGTDLFLNILGHTALQTWGQEAMAANNWTMAECTFAFFYPLQNVFKCAGQ